MSPELAAILERRARLIERAAVQRDRIALLIRECAPPLVLADRVLAAWHFVRSQPALLTAAVALIAIVKPARAFNWAVRGWTLWQAARRLWPLASELFRHGESKS